MFADVNAFMCTSSVTDLYFVFYCTVGPPGCFHTLVVTAMTDTSITVSWNWTNCMNDEPSHFMLGLSPTAPQYPMVVSSLPASHVFSGLEPNTTYSIMATINDSCGSIPSNETFGKTPPRIGECRILCKRTSICFGYE